jgi:hypothetical protein
LPRFRILIDVNQLNNSEASQLSELTLAAADGVWSVTENNCGLQCGPMNNLCRANDNFSQTSPDLETWRWPGVFSSLNGNAWTISEDEAIWIQQTLNNNAYVAAGNYVSPFPVRDSNVFYEAASSVVLAPNLLLSYAPLFGGQIVVLARNYREIGDAPAVREALNSPYVSGVAFELNPYMIFPYGDFNQAVEGIRYCLARHKRCYLLLAPTPQSALPCSINCHPRNNSCSDPNAVPNYSADVEDVIDYLAASPHNVPLNDPNLFIVLAAYARDIPPPLVQGCPTPTPPVCIPSGPGFLTADGGGLSANSVRTASQKLQAKRNIYVPQPPRGSLALVSTSTFSGWAVDPQTPAGCAQSIDVYMYVDGPRGSGGTQVGSAIHADIPRPDVNAYSGFLGDHGFVFEIPSNYFDGRSHSWCAYGLSESGQYSLLTGSPTTVALVNVSLPTATFVTSDPVTTVVIEPVTTAVSSSLGFIGFHGDFTFDSRVVSFSHPPVQPAGLTASSWTVAGDIQPGPGPIKTLRVTAFSNDGVTALSGSGSLFQLRMVRVSNTPGAISVLDWAASPNNVYFYDSQDQFPPKQTNGLVTITGPVPTGTPTPPPTSKQTPTPQPSTSKVSAVLR